MTLPPPPGDPQLAADRHRVLKDAFLDEITRPEAARRRFALPVPVPIAVAAVVVLITVAVGLALRGGPPAPQPAPVSAPIPVPSVRADGVVVLADAAATDAVLPAAPALRDDQFAYIRSKVGYQSVAGGEPFSGGTFGPPSYGVVKHALDDLHIREMWLPQKDYRAYVVDGRESFDVYASTSNSKHASVPTDPAKLLPMIYAETEGQGPGPDYSAFDWIGETLRESLLPPRVTVALFRTAARIPGVTYNDDAVDAAGRHGVALTFTDQGERREMIFDPRTLDYLGERNYLVEDTEYGEKGTITGISAVLQRAVVDQKGQRP